MINGYGFRITLGLFDPGSSVKFLKHLCLSRLLEISRHLGMILYLSLSLNRNSRGVPRAIPTSFQLGKKSHSVSIQNPVKIHFNPFCFHSKGVQIIDLNS